MAFLNTPCLPRVFGRGQLRLAAEMPDSFVCRHRLLHILTWGQL